MTSAPYPTPKPDEIGSPKADNGHEELAMVTLKSTQTQQKTKISTITDSKEALHSDQPSWYKDLDSQDSQESSDDRVSEQMMGEPRPAAQKKQKRRRRRMTKEQSQILESEFMRDHNWSTAKIKAIAERIQLGRVKVYKWSWDRKKKEENTQPAIPQTASIENDRCNDEQQEIKKCAIE